MNDELYMQRCFQLAVLGAGQVAPNPLVGAVLVYQQKIIGEGWHRKYGQAHAEVNCVADAIARGHGSLLSSATMYVSLEPCSHFGKTPPCTDLILHHRIPQVVIACTDPFKQVNGKGIEKLKTAGVQVTTGTLESQAVELNKRFFTFHLRHRPYIILKWAETADGFIGLSTGRLRISNEITDRLVHRWRSEEAAILVGTQTALADDPALTNRLWNGASPIRLVMDRKLKLPSSLQLFDRSAPTIIFNTLKQAVDGNISWHQLPESPSLLQSMTNALYNLGIQSVIVEGGASLLHSFISEGLWDEARIIQNDRRIGAGIRAPQGLTGEKTDAIHLLTDSISIYKNNAQHLRD